MLKALFFDLDGTLLDTVGDIRFHVNAMLASRGYPELSVEQTKAYIGDGARRLVERALPPDAADADGCYAQFVESFSKSDGALIRLYDGEKEVLGRLKAAGLLLAVITNKPQAAVRGTLANFFPDRFFDFIGGDSGMFPIKPDPALTRYAALSMRVSPAECAFIGDGETDVLTAKNAGMRGISVLWGYRTRAQLEVAGAREFASDFEELEEILRGS